MQMVQTVASGKVASVPQLIMPIKEETAIFVFILLSPFLTYGYWFGVSVFLLRHSEYNLKLPEGFFFIIFFSHSVNFFSSIFSKSIFFSIVSFLIRHPP